MRKSLRRTKTDNRKEMAGKFEGRSIRSNIQIEEFKKKERDRENSDNGRKEMIKEYLRICINRVVHKSSG